MKPFGKLQSQVVVVVMHDADSALKIFQKLQLSI